MNIFNPRVGVVFQLPLPLSQQIFNHRKISFFQVDVLSKLASSHKPSSVQLKNHVRRKEDIGSLYIYVRTACTA